jgi:hypothetical protein
MTDILNVVKSAGGGSPITYFQGWGSPQYFIFSSAVKKKGGGDENLKE